MREPRERACVVDPSAYECGRGHSAGAGLSAARSFRDARSGFTPHPSFEDVGEKTSGTYAGLDREDSVLQQLGITAVGC